WSCSLDTRYAPYAEKQLEQMAEKFLAVSGTSSPLFSAKYEWFANDFPLKSKQIAKYMMLSGYVIGKLGEVAIDEATIDGTLLTWTGLADVRNRKWSDVICEKLKISSNRLPRICTSDEIVGFLSETAAVNTGLRSGIPLISGAGDKIAGCVGANILNKGDMIFEAGSYAAVSCLVDDFRPDFKRKYFDVVAGAFPEDLYAHYYIPGSGISFNWFMDNFVRTKDEKLKDAFARMDENVEKIVPGCEGLMAVGMMGGTTMPFDGNLKGIWMGFNWAHKEAHFYRALQESFSYAIASAIERMEVMYPECPRKNVKVIGGGAKSKVWIQMLSDVSGRTFECIDREDAALWGASLLAAKGIGLVSDIKQKAAQFIHVKKTYCPQAEYRVQYQKLKDQYNRYAVELSPYCKNLI
ncbi:MAG: FGGY family carbohydrate kinase, partial [Lachnospiraceae bacterium]|nr:FGGY family carbohydrate kinase [Lachnospiraceae bacterium]